MFDLDGSGKIDRQLQEKGREGKIGQIEEGIRGEEGVNGKSGHSYEQ